MSIKFRKFLAAKREKAKLENRLFTWAWVGGKCACWRPIKKYRTVKRGRKRGQIEVELYHPAGKKCVVPVGHVRYKDIDYAVLAHEVRKRK